MENKESTPLNTAKESTPKTQTRRFVQLYRSPLLRPATCCVKLRRKHGGAAQPQPTFDNKTNNQPAKQHSTLTGTDNFIPGKRQKSGKRQIPGRDDQIAGELWSAWFRGPSASRGHSSSSSPRHRCSGVAGGTGE